MGWVAILLGVIGFAIIQNYRHAFANEGVYWALLAFCGLFVLSGIVELVAPKRGPPPPSLVTLNATVTQDAKEAAKSRYIVLVMSLGLITLTALIIVVAMFMIPPPL